MKKTSIIAAISLLGFAAQGWSQSIDYTNFIRQVLYPWGLVWDVTGLPPSTDPPEGRFSSLPITEGGSRFELWTVHKDTTTQFLLDSTYVGSFIPMATLDILSKDETGVVKRTRADVPFQVHYTVSGLLSEDDAPESAKSVNFLWHVQSYGENGTSEDINRDNATLMSLTSIERNCDITTEYITSVPSSVSTKARGEERFSIYSLDGYQTPSSQLAGEYIEVWPVAEGTLAGIDPGQLVRYSMPPLTIRCRDLYPFSTTYLQAYPGQKSDTADAKALPESHIVWDAAVPLDKTHTVEDYGDALGADGVWTIELVTKTPFGVDRLDYVTFNLDRTMKVRGSFSTIE